LIGAASLAGVVLAGVVAVGASVGLLQSSDSGAIGTLAADTASPTRVVDVYVDDTIANGKSQDFLVDVAGTVSLIGRDGVLRLADVGPNHGWQWELSQSSPTALRVDFTNGARTFEFAAALGRDGAITARVDETALEAQPPVVASSRYDDDEEHEGRDDDD
jgi:hypothetical protein